MNSITPNSEATPAVSDSPIYYVIVLFAGMVLCCYGICMRRKVQDEGKGARTICSAVMVLSLLYILWTVGLVLMVLLFQKLPQSAYLASVICLNVICCDLFFRQLVAQSELVQFKYDRDAYRCLFKSLPAQIHLALMTISFALTMSYAFDDTPILEYITISAICVAHLSCYVAIYFAVGGYRASILELKTNQVLEVFDQLLLNDVELTEEDRAKKTKEAYDIVSFLFYNSEYLNNDIENTKSYLNFILQIMNLGYGETFAIQLFVLIILYVSKSDDFQVRLREYSDSVFNASDFSSKLPQLEEDAKEDVQLTVAMLEQKLITADPYGQLTVALGYLFDLIYGSAKSTRLVDNDDNLDAAARRVEFTLRNLKFIERSDGEFAIYIRIVRRILRADLRQRFKNALELAVLIILFAIRAEEFQDKLREYSNAALSALSTLSELEIGLHGDRREISDARETLDMLKKEFNKLCQDILKKDCSQIDELINNYPYHNRSSKKAILERVLKDVKFVLCDVGFMPQKHYLRNVVYFLGLDCELEHYRDVLHFIAFTLLSVLIAYKYDLRLLKHAAEASSAKDKIMRLKPPQGTPESDDFDLTFQLLECELKKAEFAATKKAKGKDV